MGAAGPPSFSCMALKYRKLTETPIDIYWVQDGSGTYICHTCAEPMGGTGTNTPWRCHRCGMISHYRCTTALDCSLDQRSYQLRRACPCDNVLWKASDNTE